MIDDFCVRWKLPAEARHELLMALAGNDYAPPLETDNKSSEAKQQSLIRLEAPKHGFWLTRNNVGALMDKNGRVVRFGLANESKAQNENIKSGDLIGFRKRTIVPSDVGNVIAQFASIECKELGWKRSPTDEHEAAQARWRDFINHHGGYAAFASGPGIFHNK